MYLSYFLMIERWHGGRPIFSRLPAKGYGDNQVADALTGWVDEKLTEKAEQLQQFYENYLNPDTCLPEALDYLAYLVGLSGEYWDSEWSVGVKRLLIKNSHTKLWPKRGTKEVISFVLKAHELVHQIWTDGNLVMSFAMPGTFGSAQLRFYVRMDKAYPRYGKEFREAQRTIKNFAPAVVKNQVVYEYFLCGISQLGEPMFSEGTMTPD